MFSGFDAKNYVYTGTINLPSENIEPYMEKNGTRVHQVWDFDKSEIKQWLDDNCSGEWDFRFYGDETDNEELPIEIFFCDDTDAMAFRLEWE